MKSEAVLSIELARRSETLFVSPITAWEIGVANGKANINSRPQLGGQLPSDWFARAVSIWGAQLAPFHLDVALESARLPSLLGYGDPGDCFLIATAHVQNLTLVTRDARIIAFAKATPNYISVMNC